MKLTTLLLISLSGSFYASCSITNSNSSEKRLYVPEDTLVVYKDSTVKKQYEEAGPLLNETVTYHPPRLINGYWIDKEFKELYIDGKFEEIRYSNGDTARTFNKKTGKLETEFIDYGKTAQIDSFKEVNSIRIYYSKAGKMESKIYYTEDSGELDFSFYPDGKLSGKAEGFDIHGVAGTVWGYSESGQLDYLETTEHLPSTGGGGESDSPQVTHFKYYKNGKLTEAGNLYAGCPECDEDSVGTWKFYNENGTCRIKQFKSYKAIYKEYLDYNKKNPQLDF